MSPPGDRWQPGALTTGSVFKGYGERFVLRNAASSPRMWTPSDTLELSPEVASVVTAIPTPIPHVSLGNRFWSGDKGDAAPGYCRKLRNEARVCSPNKPQCHLINLNAMLIDLNAMLINLNAMQVCTVNNIRHT